MSNSEIRRTFYRSYSKFKVPLHSIFDILIPAKNSKIVLYAVIKLLVESIILKKKTLDSHKFDSFNVFDENSLTT